MPPSYLTQRQRELLQALSTPGVYIDKDGVLVGKGKYKKVNQNTLKGLRARRLVRQHKNREWHLTPQGKKYGNSGAGNPKTAKGVTGTGGTGKPAGETKNKGGRPRGYITDRTWVAREIVLRLQEKYPGKTVDPLEGLLEMSLDESLAVGIRKACRESAVPYLYPRIQHIEHMGAGGGPVTHEHKFDFSKLTREEVEELDRLQDKMSEGKTDSV